MLLAEGSSQEETTRKQGKLRVGKLDKQMVRKLDKLVAANTRRPK